MLKLASFAEYHHYLRFGPRADAEWDEAIDLLTTNETYFFRGGAPAPRLPRRGAADARGRWPARAAASPSGAPGARRARRPTPSPSSCTRRASFRATAGRAAGTCASTARTSPGAASPPRVAGSTARALPGHAPRADLCASGPFFQRAAGRAGTSPDFIRRHVPLRADEPPRRGPLPRRRARPTRSSAGTSSSTSTRARARPRIETFYERLYPGGVLLLGHSESLLNVSTAFELLHLREDLVYRKRPAVVGHPSLPGQARALERAESQDRREPDASSGPGSGKLPE